MGSRTPARSSKPSTRPASPSTSRSPTPRQQPRSKPPATWPKDLSPTSLPPKLRSTPMQALSRKQRRTPGKRLLSFDRRLGARFVAGADEAGRGSLAGPLVVAGVLLDYGRLRDHRVRPLALLNDSKQVPPERREELFSAIVGSAERI